MLRSNWITEKQIDFEYKSYLLLAYLKEVDESFSRSRLYPYFPDLIGHHQNLLHLRNERLSLAGKFPKELTKIDLKEPKLEYKSLLRDGEIMDEINSIVEYSIPKIEYYIEEGNSIYNLVREKINIFPVGVLPIYVKEGYILLTFFSGGRKKANIFQYCLSLYLSQRTDTSQDSFATSAENQGQMFCNIQTRYVTTMTMTAANTFENIKTQLIKNNPELPNPATFAVESELSFPLNETLLPVVKKLLVQYVAAPVSPGNQKSLSKDNT